MPRLHFRCVGEECLAGSILRLDVRPLWRSCWRFVHFLLRRRHFGVALWRRHFGVGSSWRSCRRVVHLALGASLYVVLVLIWVAVGNAAVDLGCSSVCGRVCFLVWSVAAEAGGVGYRDACQVVGRFRHFPLTLRSCFTSSF